MAPLHTLPVTTRIFRLLVEQASSGSSNFLLVEQASSRYNFPPGTLKRFLLNLISCGTRHINRVSWFVHKTEGEVERIVGARQG